MNKEKLAISIVSNVVLAFLSALMLVPLFLIINISFKSYVDFLRQPFALTLNFYIQNYIEAFIDSEMYRNFFNSIIFTFIPSGLVMILGTIASFPIARNHFRGAGFLYTLFLSGLFMPSSLVSLVVIMKFLHFYNNYPGYIIMQLASNVPVSIFLLTNFIKSLPRELDEAAIIDGCGYVRYIIQIVLPLLKPAIATVGMLTSLACWNDFIRPYLFLTNKNMRPMTSGLYIFFGQHFNNWPVLCAGIIVVASPLLVMYIFLQKYIIEGVVAGSIKG